MAYIDPGSGSYAFQLAIAGLTTVVFFFSSVKRKVVRLLKKDTIPRPSPGNDGLKKPVT
jgi:hypothetical protein